ncbi:MAG: endonuclease/exonuclease/phosphatase family protein [Solirubrobacteraceae bacterium]
MEQFTSLIAGWEWDVALLQEVPPWWPARLAARSGAEQRTALTSRNWLLPLRRSLASRRPELMKSNGGGSNAVLSRTAIVEHRALRLRLWPERRVAQLVRLGDGACVANFHGSARVPLAEAELEELWERSLSWAGCDRLIVGGDLNLRAPCAPAGVEVVHVARRDVDHLFAGGFEQVGEAELLDRRVALDGVGAVELSDHPPLRVSLRTTAAAV